MDRLRQYRSHAGSTGVQLRSVGIVSLCVLFLGVVGLSATGCVTSPATSTREDTFTVSDGASLVVNSFNGQIQVQGGAGNQVDVQATLRDTSRLRYEAVQNGNQVTVTVVKTGGWWFFGTEAKADINVTVPAGISINLKTSNGDVGVNGAIGGGVLKTSNGSVLLENVKGSFDGSTSNGRVEVTAMDGSGLFKTSNGRIDVQGLTGDCNASTSNGSISFSGEMKAGGQNRLTTSNGSVNVKLNGTPSVSLDASTSNGKVTSLLPILATKTETNSLAGTIGAGEAKLFIRTSNGSVTIQ
jgi:hypothetical protein